MYPFSANPSPTCAYSNSNIANICSPGTPNSIISYHKSTTTVNGQLQGIISMSFNNSVDYQFYKDQLIAQEASLIFYAGPLTLNPTLPEYYCYYRLQIPTTNIACGDGVPFTEYKISRTAYPNIVYVENPSNNYWSITIPMPVITNQFPQTSCSNCYGLIQQFVGTGNFDSQASTNNVSIVNTFGSKFAFPLYIYYITQGAPTITTQDSSYYIFRREMPIYSFKTLPFVSSSAGWVNLPTLEAVPCPTLVSSSMPYINNATGAWTLAYYQGTEMQYIFHFPNILTDSNWFKLYTNVTSSNGLQIQPSEYTNPPTTAIQPHLIYEYSASIGTVYSSSYFVNGAPILTIDPWPNC
jgi:hypothetical protein